MSNDPLPHSIIFRILESYKFYLLVIYFCIIILVLIIIHFFTVLIFITIVYLNNFTCLGIHFYILFTSVFRLYFYSVYNCSIFIF